MIVRNQRYYEVISSKFTRKKGYINVKSSKKFSHKKAINILNSFTPQGASPKISIRIGKYEDKVGVGYYFMEDHETASILTVLMKFAEFKIKDINFPYKDENIKNIALGNHKFLFSYDIGDEYIFHKNFNNQQFGSILYSLLAGDNMIIVHPQHSKQVQFIKSLFRILPPKSLNYNRITTGCSELDGNENIVGVSELPTKYRSHKKLFLPLDTIFIDLVNNKIQGEGVKSCEFTKNASSIYKNNKIEAIEILANFINEVTKNQDINKNSAYEKKTNLLINQIQYKSGMVDAKSEDWIMGF